MNLDVNGVNVGNKEIAYSPSVLVANILVYKPNEPLQISWLSKFVGEQFMNNIESPQSKLVDYFVTDLNISYEYKTKSVFKSIVFNGLINNIIQK